MLDKSQNANPKFSNTLSPIHVWIMNTNHGIDIKGVTGELSFVPQAILSKVFDSFNKTDRSETHIYVIAHDKETDKYNVYLGHSFGKESKNAFSNLQHVEIDRDASLQNVKLNELHFQYRPDWSGERQEPMSKDVESMDDLMSFLEENKAKELFLKIFPLTDSTDSPITAMVPSPITKKEAKPPKLTKARREALVKRFGEENIKALETRMGLNNKKDDKNKKG